MSWQLLFNFWLCCYPYNQCIFLLVYLPPYPHTQQTLFQFISRPKFSSIIFTHNPPSVEQSKVFHYITYLLIIPPSPIRIPYIISIVNNLIISAYFFSSPPHTQTHQTLLQFIIRPKFTSIIVTNNPPSAEQIIFCYQILYILNIMPSPMRIPYIRSIIVTPHNHLT